MFENNGNHTEQIPIRPRGADLMILPGDGGRSLWSPLDTGEHPTPFGLPGSVTLA